MREAKKRFGIPVALWLIIAMVGVACAWYCFATITSTTNVQESLSAAETSEFSTDMYPGDTNTWYFTITNANDHKSYSIKADLTYSAPPGVSIDSFVVGGINKDISDGYTTFNILPDTTISCSMTIRAAGDAETGTVTATLDLSRA